jgi:hypothetical protein
MYFFSIFQVNKYIYILYYFFDILYIFYYIHVLRYYSSPIIYYICNIFNIFLFCCIIFVRFSFAFFLDIYIIYMYIHTFDVLCILQVVSKMIICFIVFYNVMLCAALYENEIATKNAWISVETKQHCWKQRVILQKYGRVTKNKGKNKPKNKQHNFLEKWCQRA